MQTYPWFDQVPEHLKTRRQLAEQGLRPGGPIVAQVVWRRGKAFANLYDVSTAKPKRVATEAQLAALEKAHTKQSTCPGCGTVFSFIIPYDFDCPECGERGRAADCKAASEKARKWLAYENAVLLDTETTDLDGYCVQIGIIDLAGSVLLDSLVNPEAPISPEAYRIHGLAYPLLDSAPTFADLAPRIGDLLRGKRVLVYNAPFDFGILCNEVARLGTEVDWLDQKRWRCIMRLHARWYGDYSEYHGDYRWQPLAGGDHTAIGDCRAALDTLRRMATDANTAD